MIFQSFTCSSMRNHQYCQKMWQVLRKFLIPQHKGFGYQIHPYLLMCTLIWDDSIPHGIPNTIAAANKYIYFRHKKNCLASGTSLQNYYPRICYPIFVLIEYICVWYKNGFRGDMAAMVPETILRFRVHIRNK